MPKPHSMMALAALALPDGAPAAATAVPVADKRLQPVSAPQGKDPMSAAEVDAERSRETGLTPAQLQQERLAMANAILTDPTMGGDARAVRTRCMDDRMTESVARMRTTFPIIPDAADYCLAAMTRQAHDGHLLVPYEMMAFGDATKTMAPAQQDQYLIQFARLKEAGQSPAAALPQQIADAIAAKEPSITLPNGTKLDITPGLAHDVGFIGGYSNRGENRPGRFSSDAVSRKATTQCVDQKADAKTCFVIGYIQGADAYQIYPPAVPDKVTPLVTSRR